MEVLACIPELAPEDPCPAHGRPDAGLSAGPPDEPAVPDAVPGGAVEAVAPVASPAPSPEPPPAPERRSARRQRSARFPAPSIIALAAVAAVVWAAAWRNDRLRLEAARQQRPERLARELPAAAGTERSVVP